MSISAYVDFDTIVKDPPNTYTYAWASSAGTKNQWKSRIKEKIHLWDENRWRAWLKVGGPAHNDYHLVQPAKEVAQYIKSGPHRGISLKVTFRSAATNAQSDRCCRMCGGPSRESDVHILASCPALSKERESFFAQIKSSCGMERSQWLARQPPQTVARVILGAPLLPREATDRPAKDLLVAIDIARQTAGLPSLVMPHW